ncbi:carotenoid oxygenase family protein [Sphaerisporangium fuscum]|uniref:carotenoid oxygenase family protein n=1 Tax=Sphaerisporangium fuscum TaxID=2835868 RepID=UPI001BDC7F6A|nr:carotenoid oxygenase family protein [Sphaerisporangium fuscum]
MTVAEHAVPFAAPVRLPADEPLAVDGVIPSDLTGVFLQAGAHPGRPAWPHAGSRALLSGVRFTGGTARRHRTADVPGVPLPTPPGTASGGPGAASFATPVRDPATGRWHTVATYPGLGVAEHLVAGPCGRIEESRSFTLDGAPMMPAIALTERFVVIFDLPVVHHRAAAMMGSALPYRWRYDRPARVGLLPRQGGQTEPRWFPIAPCFVSEAVNAFQAGHRVVVDAVRHDRAYESASREPGEGAVHRWTLDLADGTAVERPLTGAMAAATVDSRHAGRRHQFVFGTTPGGDAVVTRDLAAETIRVRPLGPGVRAGRPVFVPRGTAEGHGWLVVATRDAARRCGALLVLDALHPDGEPQAVVHLPEAPPAAPYTAWLPA